LAHPQGHLPAKLLATRVAENISTLCQRDIEQFARSTKIPLINRRLLSYSLFGRPQQTPWSPSKTNTSASRLFFARNSTKRSRPRRSPLTAPRKIPQVRRTTVPRHRSQLTMVQGPPNLLDQNLRRLRRHNLAPAQGARLVLLVSSPMMIYSKAQLTDNSQTLRSHPLKHPRRIMRPHQRPRRNR
jgi:hypothetical protein